MKQKSLRLMPILMAIMMVFTMMPMIGGAVYADDTDLYTVTIDPGEVDGTPVSGTPLTISSTTILTNDEARGDGYDKTLGCFYYHKMTGDLEYKLPLQCAFTAPEGKEFGGWYAKWEHNPGSECPLNWIFDDGSKSATITAQWKDVEPDPTIEYSTPESINVNYDETRTAFDVQVTDASFTQGKTECKISLWDSAFTCSENGGSIPFTMNGNGTGDWDNRFLAGGGAGTGYKFYTYSSTTLPYTVQAYIDISSDDWAAAGPGEYTATLQITDAFGGARNIPLTLTVPDLKDIGNYEVSFDNQYLVEDDDPTTPYVEQYYVVPEGTVLSPVVARGDTVLSTDCYKARYSEVYYNEENGEYNLIDENDWTEAFPTTHGEYLCIVEGVDPFYGSVEWIPIIRIPIDENDEYELANYQATFDEEYLVEDDDPSTPYVEQYYDVPEGIVPKLTVSKGGNDLGLGCYKALYSEVYYNEEKGEYNLIDEDAWSIEFPSKQGVYLCKVDGVSPYHCSVGNMIPLIRITTDISKDKVELSKASFVYNGKVQKPSVKTVGGKTLKEGKDYTVSWSNASSKNAGTYTVTVKGKGIYKGTTKATYTIAKAANPLTIKAKTATVKGSTKGKNGKLKKTKTLAVSKVIAFTKKGQGKMTYTKSSGSKKITINKTTGKVTVKKGLKKGTYKVKVKVKAAGNTNYKASAWKTVTFKVKVK